MCSSDLLDEKPLRRAKAIILSMTAAERRNPDILDGGRRRRIARGSGASMDEVHRLLKSHKQMRQVMKQMKSEGGIMNKLMDRRLRKDKEKQLRDLKRRGIRLNDLGFGQG